MSDPIIGADWVARYPERFPAALIDPASIARDPCPICGHPTGDCAPHTEVLMAQGPTPRKAPAKKAPAKKAAGPVARVTPGDPMHTGPATPRAAALSDGADPDAPTDQATGLPEGNAADGNPVGINDNAEITGGGHEVSRAAGDGQPQPGVGPDSGSDLPEQTPRRRREKGTIPDGFVEANGLLTSTRDMSIRFLPAGTTRHSQLLVFPAGSVWTPAAVLERLAMYEDRPDAELV